MNVSEELFIVAVHWDVDVSDPSAVESFTGHVFGFGATTDEWTLTHAEPCSAVWTSRRVEAATRLALSSSWALDGATVIVHRSVRLGGPGSWLAAASGDTQRLCQRAGAPGVWLTAEVVAVSPGASRPVASVDVMACGVEWTLERFDEEALLEAIQYKERFQEIASLVEEATSSFGSRQARERLIALGRRAVEIDQVMEESLGVDDASCVRILCGLGRWRQPLWATKAAQRVCAELVADRQRAGERFDELCLIRMRQLNRAYLHDEARAFDAWVQAREDVPYAFRLRVTFEHVSILLQAGERERARELLHGHLDRVERGDDHGLKALLNLWLMWTMTARDFSNEEEFVRAKLDMFEKAYDHVLEGEEFQLSVVVLLEWAGFLSALQPARALELANHAHQRCAAMALSYFETSIDLVRGFVALRLGHYPKADRIRERLRNQLDSQEVNTNTIRFHVLQVMTAFDLEDFHEARRRFEALRSIRGEVEFSYWDDTMTFLETMIDAVTWDGHRHLGWDMAEPEDPTPQQELMFAWLIQRLYVAHHTSAGDVTEALGRTIEALVEHEKHYPYDETRDMVWRAVFLLYPEQVRSRGMPALVIASSEAWLVSPDGVRHDLRRRAQLQRLLDKLIETHRSGAGGLSTVALFEACWPGEKASYETMKNRVYVNVSRLRGMGLKGLITAGELGYALDGGVMAVRWRAE